MKQSESNISLNHYNINKSTRDTCTLIHAYDGNVPLHAFVLHFHDIMFIDVTRSLQLNAAFVYAPFASTSLLLVRFLQSAGIVASGLCCRVFVPAVPAVALRL